jgi:hypothetical protein
MPANFHRDLDKLFADHAHYERMKAEEQAQPVRDRVGAIYALVGLGCLALLTAFFLERM